MTVHITQRNDYSYLFSGLNQNGSGSMSNFLSDYASIKNGSYGKLMRAYYNESSDEVKKLAKSSNTSFVSDAQKKALTNTEKATDALKDSADALLLTGKDSVFEKGGDAAFDAVKNLVKNYNDVLVATKDVENSLVVNRVENMTSNTSVYAKQLKAIGITVNTDNTLSIDKDSFQKADTNKVQALFQGAGSFGYQTSAQASLINYSAEHAQNAKNLYTGNAVFAANNNIGNLFNSFF